MDHAVAWNFCADFWWGGWHKQGAAHAGRASPRSASSPAQIAQLTCNVCFDLFTAHTYTEVPWFGDQVHQTTAFLGFFLHLSATT